MLNDLVARRQGAPTASRSCRVSGDIIGCVGLARGPRGHALERPDLWFDAARTKDRLAELNWLCRGRAFEGALAAGLRPPAALFVNVEPEVVDGRRRAIRQASRGATGAAVVVVSSVGGVDADDDCKRRICCSGSDPAARLKVPRSIAAVSSTWPPSTAGW
jgi:hypothetical protein